MKPVSLPIIAAKTTTADHWQQYTDNARRFALDWAHETDEKGEAHSFWDELLLNFKIRRRNFVKLDKKLEAFQRKLHGLRFLDPACGCGNFLVVTYRELRRLDFDVVRAIRLRTGQFVKKLKAIFQTIENTIIDHYDLNKILPCTNNSTLPWIPSTVYGRSLRARRGGWGGCLGSGARW
ncbi:MAG: hypothetical protein GC192_11675 [Bacteroidetes bacterium]|nr:hypothetical protein [Bacteroidota bacterium]